jgi:hypothetical protein
MECSVLFTDEFECWWNTLTIEEYEQHLNELEESDNHGESKKL